MNVENYETNEGQQSLSHSTRLLREKFSLTANAFASGTAENATTELNAGLTDAAERFQLWAGSVGAAVDPQRKVSLEWRLRDAPEIKDRIHELQSDLIEALDDLLDIATGQRQSRSRPADSIILDPESDSDQETSYVDIGAMNEAQDILGAAMECVRSLLQLSILIRKATPRNRWDRALQKPKTDRLDDQFDIRHVGDKFPKLNRPEYDWLKVRLGRAITQRRQFIRYSRDHKSQMSSWEDERQKQSPVPELTHHFALPSADEAPGTAGVVDAMTLRPPITEGSTKASTLQVAALDAIKIDEDDDEASAISSVVSSLDFIDGGEDILHLPTLSAVNHGRDEFECPLCFTIQNFRQQRRWKKHAYADLKPYVCCGGKGECDLELFGDRNFWFNHELDSHRHNWTCFLCQKEISSLPQFHSHVENKHSEIAAEQIPDVAKLCKKPLQHIPASDCPFCDDYDARLRTVQGVAETEVVVVPAHTFRRHVAFHLEQLALFALGTHESPDAPPLSGSTNSQDIASAPDYNLIEHFLDTQEKFDDDETLPMDYDVSPNGSIESFSSVPKLPTETATDDVRNSDVISSPLHERPKITAHKESVSELQSMLEFGPGMESIDLGLSDPHRYLIHRGDLLSMTGKNSVATHTQGVHAILLDNYFILAQPNAPNLKDFVRYTITQMPIPIDLLALEHATIFTQNYYSFSVVHLGSNTYDLAAETLEARVVWWDSISKLKLDRAENLRAKNTEPFGLRILANAAFGSESVTQIPVLPQLFGPLRRVIEEFESQYGNMYSAPINKVKANCATSYTSQDQNMIAVGTDIGVYITKLGSTEIWLKAMPISEVTQLAILQTYSLVLVLSGKTLLAYHLDSLTRDVATPGHVKEFTERNTVEFFITCRQKERDFIIYCTKKGIGSSFTVIEVLKPFGKPESRISAIFSRNRESFRQYAEFYIPKSCMGINAFSSSIVILTSDGFEILSLDDPQPSPVPHWKEPNLSDAEIGPEIRHELSSSTPLGMFLFRGGTFNPSVTSLCVYDTFALYMTGSRAVYGSKLIQFSGRAKRATARGGYLLLFHEDFVEIRAMYDGSLKQIISGKEIICIDDGTANGGNVKMAMQHPKNALLQVILEVVLYADTDQSQASFA